MVIPGELRFHVAFVFIFVVFPVIGVILRHKWRLEVARKEEISWLIGLAADEPASSRARELDRMFCRAEPVVAVGGRVCAVCYDPTTNRCARCKSIHYCSGKCQIIHWRQGHKDECRPSPSGSEINDEAGSFVGNALKQPTTDNFVAHIENDVLSRDEQGEAVLERRRSSNNAFVSRDLSVKDDSASAPGHDACIDYSTSDEDSLHDLNSEASDLSSTFENIETGSSDTRLEEKKPLEEKTYVRMEVDGSISEHVGFKDEAVCEEMSSLGSRVSYSAKNSVEPSISTSGFWDGILDTTRTSTYGPSNNIKPKPVGVNNKKLTHVKSTVRFSSELSGGHSSDKQSQVPETLIGNNQGTAKFAKLVETTSSNKSLTLSSKGPNRIKRVDEIQIKSGEDGIASDTLKDVSLSLSSSRANYLEKKNYDTQQLHTAPNAVSVKVVNSAAIPPQTAKSTPSFSVGLKSSMLKVVEPMRAPRSSKQGDGVATNGEQAVLAYDLFVNLYHWNKVELRPCGLVNCGNSCYANVVLQCLAFTPPLTAYLLQGLHSKACVKKEWCFTCEFERLVFNTNEVGYAQSPIGILSKIQTISSHLTKGREEDAHEFLRYAIEMMQSICLKEAGVKASSSLEEETTLMGITFGGYLRSKIKCTRCHGKSESRDRIMDLTVEIEGDIETLEDALRQFTGTESLDGENKYHCGRCKSYEKAKKKLNILDAPNVLTIALKRFQSGKFGKLNKSILFPEILNLAPYMRGGRDEAPIYRLYGVVVHLDIMNASFSGHYVCYVRNAQNKWFKIDDSMVMPVDLEQVLNRGAYMLFYSRCSPRAPRSIRNTVISRDLSSMIKSTIIDPSWSNVRINTSRQKQRDLPAHANPIPNTTQIPFQMQNSSEGDSSSDNSSLFTNSDEVSTSTDSTQESTSADDFLEHIFGYNAPFRSSDSETSSSSSSSSSYSPQYPKHSPLSNPERYDSAHSERNVRLTDNGKTHHETSRPEESSSF